MNTYTETEKNSYPLKGNSFDTKKQLQAYVDRLHIDLRREYLIKTSNKSCIYYKCRKSDCDFSLAGRRSVKNSDLFKITQVKPHVCEVGYGKFNTKSIIDLSHSVINYINNIKPSSLINYIKNDFGLSISYISYNAIKSFLKNSEENEFMNN